MKRFIRLLAVGSATLAFAGVANAQITFTRPPSGYGSPQPGTGTALFNIGVNPNATPIGSNPPAVGDPFAYDFYWHSVASAGLDWLWSGPFMWSFFNGGVSNFGGPGDSVRICYGIDVTQGGRNWSGTSPTTIGVTPGPFDGGVLNPGGSTTENTYFRWAQGFAPGNAGVGIGLMSVQAETSSARGADQCFGPFFHGLFRVGAGAFTPLASETGGHKVAAAIIGGTFAGTSPGPFPAVWELTFAWGPTPALIPNLIGDNSGDPGIPEGLTTGGGATSMNLGVGSSTMAGPIAPLLANVIFEVQAPLNANINNTNIQYYLASTSEFTGIKPILAPSGATSGLGYLGTGGVSNGNGNMGLNLFNTPANVPNHAGDTNRIAGSRIFAVVGAGLLASSMPDLLFPANQKGTPHVPFFRDGRMEMAGQLAFTTPKLWAYHHLEKTPLGMRPTITTKGVGHTPGGNTPAGSPLSQSFWGMATPFTTLPAGTTARMEGRDGSNIPLLGANFMLFTGNGGPDWRMSSAPLSKVDIITIDHCTGAEAAFNVYAKVGVYATMTPAFTGTPAGPYAHAPMAFDTSIGVLGKMAVGPPTPTQSCRFNALEVFFYTIQAPTLLFASTVKHPQMPGSWGYAALPPAGVAGDEHTQGQPAHPFGLSANVKQGVQAVPLGFMTGDPLFGPLLSDAFLTFSTRFSRSDDFFTDGALDYGGNIVPSFSSIFQGMWEPETSGQADLKGPTTAGGNQTFVGFPDPTLCGVGLNIAGQSVAFNNCTGGPAVLVINEVANSLRINFQ